MVPWYLCEKWVCKKRRLQGCYWKGGKELKGQVLTEEKLDEISAMLEHVFAS
jgi:hypothetical protein